MQGDVDMHVYAEREFERDRILDILKSVCAEGRTEASMAAAWSDVHHSGFAAGLTALKQLFLS